MTGFIRFPPNEPVSFDLTDSHPWKSIRVVKAKRAYFYPSATARTHRKDYLVTGDGVGVRSRSHGRLEVDYQDGPTVSGWMNESDFFR